MPTTDDKTIAKVIDLYEAGTKLADITKDTGVPRSSIYWILQREGIDPNRQGTRRAAEGGEALVESMRWMMERIENLAADKAQLEQELAECRAALVRATNNGNGS